MANSSVAQPTAALQVQCEKLQHRLDTIFEDKLDGKIDQEFYDKKKV